MWDLIKIEVLSSLLSYGSAEGEAAAGRLHEAALQMEAVPRELTISGAGREELLQSDTGPDTRTTKPGRGDAANPKELAIVIIFAF